MNNFMKAIVKAEPGRGFELREVPIPKPGMREVLIKIRKTAICGTDLHIYNWDKWSEKNILPPLIVGHEYVGEVAAFGADVNGLTIGERVSGEGHIVCHQCRNCRSGNSQWCKHTKGVGVNRDGAFAEYICIPESNVIPINPRINEEVVAFFDAYGNATHTALMFDVVGEDVLITGAGAIGVMAAAICKRNGARSVVVTDMNDYRLALAKRMGATDVVNISRERVEDVFAAHHIVEGFDVGLEMSGSPAALSSMISLMRNGGKIAMLGILSSDARVDFNEIIFKGLTMQGVYGRRMYETWYKMMAMVEGGLDLTPIITHRFHYTEFEKGFEAMNTGLSGKVILDWTN